MNSRGAIPLETHTHEIEARAAWLCVDLAGFGAKLEIILYSHHGYRFDG